MAYRIPCPGCGKAGLVRMETVITGATSSRQFYCGGCEHQWSIADPSSAVVTEIPPLPKPRTRSYGPKRRG